jgi:hypothetical protein
MRYVLSAEFDRRHFSLHAAFQQGDMLVRNIYQGLEVHC